MTKQWQFPAWEDMQEIDSNKPLVTRSGRLATGKIGLNHVIWVNNGVIIYDVSVRGRYDSESELGSPDDVQNPPEWAYAQFGIEPPNEGGQFGVHDEERKWQFPAWEDMQEIDVSKPLVTRDGYVVTAKDRGDGHPCYPYDVVDADKSAMWTVTHKGLDYEYSISAIDVQNPPEWAYGQFSIEPPKESARLNAADEAIVDSKSAATDCSIAEQDCEKKLHVEISHYLGESFDDYRSLKSQVFTYLCVCCLACAASIVMAVRATYAPYKPRDIPIEQEILQRTTTLRYDVDDLAERMDAVETKTAKQPVNLMNK